MIEVEVKDEAVIAAIERALSATGNLKPLMKDIGDFLTESTRQRFLKGESPEGVKWALKSQTTIAAYERRGEKVDFRPLFGPTGDLNQSIAYAVGDDHVLVGSALNYSATMQFGAKKGAFGTAANGSSVPWGDIPARPYLGISSADRDEILRLVDRWLANLIDDPNAVSGN